MSKHPLTYAELHLHLGGAIIPRILYSFMLKSIALEEDTDRKQIALQNLARFPTYEQWEAYLTRKSDNLSDYLQTHKIVEPMQHSDTIGYMVARLLRGCYIFENMAYLEMRFNPYWRIPRDTPDDKIHDEMAKLVRNVADAAEENYREYPIVFYQILCMDSRLPLHVNRAILELAREMNKEVCAVDIAGPNEAYADNEADLIQCLKLAKETYGMNVTCHLFETPKGCYPSMLPYCDRIGHGIQIPLRYPELLADVAKRGQCLEVCPTSYFRTGTLNGYHDLVPVFQKCQDAGVDIAVCTDNSAFHGVRLPLEFERLLTHKVINFRQLEACRSAAFRHAFRWPGTIDYRANDVI